MDTNELINLFMNEKMQFNSLTPDLVENILNNNKIDLYAAIEFPSLDDGLMPPLDSCTAIRPIRCLNEIAAKNNLRACFYHKSAPYRLLAMYNENNIYFYWLSRDQFNYDLLWKLIPINSST